MIIAEIGTSHEGSFEKAKRLIDAAADCGADAAKFQWVYADEILHPKTGFVDLPTGRIPLYERFNQLECPKEFYKAALEYAHSKNLKFVCSPFGVKSLEQLLELNPDAVKIASPELNHFPMLRKLAQFRARQISCGENPIRVIVSSGVSKLKDIEAALEILGKENVALLHCVTAYPAPEDDYNVRLVSTLREIFGVETGISDHSLDAILVPCLAAAEGAACFEKHITLSKKTSGLDDPVALEPEQFLQMTQALRQCETALNHYGRERGRQEIINQISMQYGSEHVEKVLGSGVKSLATSEEKNYGRTNRSLRYVNTCSCAHILQESDVGVLRTEKILTPGIPPEFLERVIGKTLARKVESGDPVCLEDFMN
ncbi:MAG: spore coat protein [Treponema sp.]|nr:spore coat protein [Treponema sp.]